MPYRVVEHTADLAFEVRAGSFRELLVEALGAMTEWTAPAWGTESAERPFSIESPDPSCLLVDLLNEALTLSQIHYEAYDSISFDELSRTVARGAFTGRRISGARDEIKAVTYHGAQVEESSDGVWSAAILMDI